VAQKHILIAVDGSPAATAAVDAGLEVAAAMEARVTFVHASSRLAWKDFAQSRPRNRRWRSCWARTRCSPPLSDGRGTTGVDADAEMIAEEGGAARLGASIAGVAHGLDAMMIVVGSRGLGAVSGGVLGSVSQNVIRLANVPVLVVTEAGRPAAPAA
jgi:nucleotide-binding universal stress UspA family protein